MPTKRYKPEQIVTLLLQIEVEIAIFNFSLQSRSDLVPNVSRKKTTSRSAARQPCLRNGVACSNTCGSTLLVQFRGRKWSTSLVPSGNEDSSVF
jgi:hypothetical protein